MMLRYAALCCFVFLAACANPGGAPPFGDDHHPPPGQIPGTETFTASSSQSLLPLPPAGSTYGGGLVIPPGSGRATLTFSYTAPPSITPLNPNTPQPAVAYLTITADTAFTLQSNPGLNLTVPQQDMAIVMWLNRYSGGSWSSRVLGTPSTTTGVSAMCFATAGSAVSLAPGESLYLGINGDDVIPTPIPGATPMPACPQS